MSTALEVLAAEAMPCTKCKLATAGRTQVVFGMGAPDADLMFIGEGPGAEEDKQGLPFVGRSGQLLDKVLYEEFGWTRDRVYIGNVVKCLRYNVPIQLGDGRWERIGRLVRSRYDGSVISVDDAGQLVPRRVIGWHASPVAGRRVFRLTYRAAKRTRTGTVSTQLTGDHEVLSDAGWMPVQDLQAGQLIATGQGLSRLARDVVVGTLLGDGHLNRASSHLSFSHCEEQADYALFKARLLEELAPRSQWHRVADGADHKRRRVIHVRTLAFRSLRLLADEFYRPKKVVPSWLEHTLNERMLAIWFMDDGYTRIRSGGRQPSAEIATCCFTDGDLRVLQAGLAGLGLTAKILRGRLHFDVNNTRHLSKLIAPYVPTSMRYKLHPEVEQEVRFDPSMYETGFPEVLYDEPVIEELRHTGTDKTFYCIDVEETHNFVTAGGVVHNCRPPGNRDPEPDEIDACRPWLEKQIELIEPKVIVTLGNFATKLLLETKEGITKLRGRVYPFRTGVLIPTFHPAAVLRGGGEPLAQMRADFIRAKRALADAGSQA